MAGRDLATAYGVEAKIWVLQNIYESERFEIVYRGIDPSIPGPDAILWDNELGRAVFIEGKGTATRALTELDYRRFTRAQALPTQLSLGWLTTRPERFLDRISNPATRDRVEDIINEINTSQVARIYMIFASSPP